MRKALDARTGKNRRQRIRHAQHDSDDDSDDVETGDVDPRKARGEDRNSPIVVYDMDITDGVVKTELERTAAQPATSITFGGALRRNGDKPVAIPVMVKRQPKASKITRRVSYSQFLIPAYGRLTELTGGSSIMETDRVASAEGGRLIRI